MKFREWLARECRKAYWTYDGMTDFDTLPGFGKKYWLDWADSLIAALHEAAKDPESGVRVVEAMTLGSGVQVFDGVTLNGPVMQLNIIVPGPGKAFVIWIPEEKE